MSMNGVDIASYQTGINLGVVPCDFAIVKATEGTTYVNPSCNAQVASCLGAGKKLGLYHFASGGNAIGEADFFVNNIEGYIGKAILVLDWEADAINYGVSYAKQFLDRVLQRTGVHALIYMSNSVVNAYDWSSVANANYGLWNAGYYAGYEPMGYQADPPIYGSLGVWGGCAIYQYTSSGQVANWGGNLDLNIFYGDGSAWDAYAKGNGTVTGGSVSSNKPVNGASGPAGSIVDFIYSVRAGGKVYEEVTNLNDFAGVRGTPITDIAIRCSKGSVRYRVHILGRPADEWLDYVTGCDWNDPINGFAGNGQIVDAVEVYYDTPQDIISKYGYQKAQYRVSPVSGTYYPWQYDNDTGNGQDGFAGAFGVAMDRFQLY